MNSTDMNNSFVIKISFTCLLSFLCLCCRSQHDWQRVTIDDGYNYSVPNFGQLKRTLDEGADTITAEITINNDLISKIQFAKAGVNRDTLRVYAYGLNEATYDKLSINVAKGKYHVDYTFIQSGEQETVVLKELQSKLVLNTIDFRRGSVIRGYIEYKSKCRQGCVSQDYLIQIKGSFVVVVR